MGTLRQPSVEDGNDSSTIVSSEQAPTLDQGIEAGRTCVGFCVVLCGEWRFSRAILWRFESQQPHYWFVHSFGLVRKTCDNSGRSIGFHSVLRFFADACCDRVCVGFSASIYDGLEVMIAGLQVVGCCDRWRVSQPCGALVGRVRLHPIRFT